MRAQIAGIRTSTPSTETAPAGLGESDATRDLRPAVCFGVCFCCFGCFCCSFARPPFALLTCAYRRWRCKRVTIETGLMQPECISRGANAQELTPCREAHIGPRVVPGRAHTRMPAAPAAPISPAPLLLGPSCLC